MSVSVRQVFKKSLPVYEKHKSARNKLNTS